MLAQSIRDGEAGAMASLKVQRELHDWLVEHVMKLDKDVGDYIAAKGGA